MAGRNATKQYEKSLSNSNPFQFVTLDIENRRGEGSLLSIDVCWRAKDETFLHAEFFRWIDFIEWCFDAISIDGRFKRIYAHNGGGWDWPSLIGFLIKDRKCEIEAIPHGSTLAAVILKRDGKRIELHDSLKLLPASLEALGQTFCGEGKADKSGKTEEWLFDNDRASYIRYHRKDTELLLRVLENSLLMIQEKIAPAKKFSMTLAATAFKCFIDHYCPVKIESPINTDLRVFLRLAYTGGRVEVFRAGEFRNLRIYDVNSLYPSVMARIEVPYTPNGYWTKTLELDRPSCYWIRWSQTRRDILPILMKGGNGEYEGIGHFYSPELTVALELDPQFQIQVIKGFVFRDCAKIFERWVDTVYGMRLSAKVKGDAQDTIGKLFGNSLYGRFGMKTRRSKIVMPDDFRVIEEITASDDRDTQIIDEKTGIFLLTETLPYLTEHCGIAGMITSEARATLYRGFHYVGHDRIIYCDTDSIHTDGVLPAAMVSESILGSWKLEFEGKGVYVGKKTYALQNSKGTKIKAKGIRVRKPNKADGMGAKLTYGAMLCLVQKQRRLKCRFKGATTVKQVLKGMRPCIMLKKTRTLRRTAA